MKKLLQNHLKLNVEEIKQLTKFSRKAAHHIASPFTIGLVFTIILVMTAQTYYRDRDMSMTDKEDNSLSALLTLIHEKSIDWRLTQRGPMRGSDRVAVLAVDERAIIQEGRWPWSREKQARMVERAVGYGAKSVSFDIAYSESDETTAIPTLRKLKRHMANKPPSVTGEVLPLIDSELSQVDGDQAFGNMLKRLNDRMILGSFIDGFQDRYPGYVDFCTDAVFERTAAARYWKSESSPLKVIDHTLTKINFPSAFKSKLSEYLLVHEVQEAMKWFEEHPEKSTAISEHLDELAPVITPNNFPGIATLWLNNDVDQAKDLLAALKPELANDEGVRHLFDLFGSAFTKQEIAALSYKVQGSANEFCKHFLTERDELFNLQTFKKVYGEDEDAQAQFNEYAWESQWKLLEKNRQPASNGVTETFAEFVERLKRDSPLNRILDAKTWVVNIPVIAAFTKHTGYFNAQLDMDGTIRRSYLVSRSGNNYMPSLALKQFLTDQNYSATLTLNSEKPRSDRPTMKGVEALEIFGADGKSVMTIPTDKNGYLMVNFSGPPTMFPHVSAADILSDTPKLHIEINEPDGTTGRWKKIIKSVDKKEFLKDKLLVAGATAIGVYDLRVTPFEENYPGVETHANVLSNLLVENERATGKTRSPASAPGFLKTHTAEEKTMWMILLGLGVVLSGLLTYYGSIAGLSITAAALGGVYAVDRYVFFANGIVTTVIFPIVEICGSFVTLTFYKYFTEERKKRELKGTFEKYVSPAIVAEVMADPENIELGGKKMELTVLFSDVRGFTTISEKLDPRQLSDLLNSYLTPMTDLVFKNKGTLDKYMGDAIMAFWGAPIHFDDHAKHAARCSLQMIEKLKVLQDEYRAKGLPNIDIGIGLNTGDMSVGNMGSETVRSYTVMGDSVNLGSRLEGINKEYGTRIIVSEFTQKAIADSFITREVDWVRVKGKAQPVRIFELIAEGQATPEVADLLKHFNSGFALYHERKFTEAIAAFQEALKVRSDDAVSQLYIERCEDYLKEPPGADWDGVCTMTHK